MNDTMITLYGIANCDTIKKTRQWLSSHQIAVDFHDYKKQGIDAKLATQMLQAVPLAELINKRGTTWRKLAPSVQADLNPQTALTLMLSQPSVIRRPLLRHGSRWIVGYDELALRALLPS